VIERPEEYAKKSEKEKIAWLRKLTLEESARIMENLLSLLREPALRTARPDHPTSISIALLARRLDAKKTNSRSPRRLS